MAALPTDARRRTKRSGPAAELTPARRQYLELKAQHPDALLLLRMGDFYETFDQDAELASRVLGIALTSRPMGKAEGRIPMAGVPHHALERYLDQLVAAGHRVAIAEQMSPPGNGLVERRVTRVVTPGTVEGGVLLAEREHNWLVALAPDPRGADPRGAARSGDAAGRWGLAACDVTTGDFECQLVDADALAGEWARLNPRELLLAGEAGSAGWGGGLPEVLGSVADAGALITHRPPHEFSPARATARLMERLEVASLDGFGLAGMDAAIGAAGAIFEYLEESWPAALANLKAPRALRSADYVYLDRHTRRNLDLFGGADGAASLIETIDRARTAMGARLLRTRLGRPLRRAADVERRLDAVQAWVEAPQEREALRTKLRGLPDLERLLGRVRAGSAGARHLVQLRAGLDRLPALAGHVQAAGADAGPVDGLGGVVEPAAAIAAALVDDPPAEPGEHELIRPGFDPQIDALRVLAHDARSALAALETRERERSGIGSLRVGYHRVFGYYLEVPRSQAGRVPEEYEPRQTLAQTQRYRCPALGKLESDILSAKDRLLEAEREALDRLRTQVAAAGSAIERAAVDVARIDVAAGLAEFAVETGCVRPELDDHSGIDFEDGRHPIVEAGLPAGGFVPNDCALGGDAGADIVLLTGPNMGGKSTYLRQCALIVLLAQVGSYVPASRAHIGTVDRIFSRVGAQDEIAAGRSTFMVEMIETAEILHNATERSLVVLDEIGRGTSTQDGLAIARAVVESLHHRAAGSPRTLFATHFHELTALASTLPRVANRSVAVREEHGEVVFLHRIVDGGADRSYGVHVAALAGLPGAVVERARELLRELEATGGTGGRGWAAPGTGGTSGSSPDADHQLSLLGDASEPLLEELAALEPDGLTPIAALQRLYELRREARDRLGIEG